MNNFNFTPSIRHIDNIVIIFRDKHTVIVLDGKSFISFHRWFDRHRFDYAKYWNPFCQALRRRKHLALSDCYALAYSYQISSQSYTGDIDTLIQEITNM